MAGFMSLVIMAMAAAQPPSEAQAETRLDVVAGVRLGDTRAVVEAKWKEFGPITATNSEDGSVELESGSDKATICQGKVVTVSRVLGDDFNIFAEYANLFMREHGQPEKPDIFAANADIPTPDSQGATPFKSSVIRLQWRAAPDYILGYMEVNEDRSAFESLVGKNSCAKTQER